MYARDCYQKYGSYRAHNGATNHIYLRNYKIILLVRDHVYLFRNISVLLLGAIHPYISTLNSQFYKWLNHNILRALLFRLR